MTPPSPQRLAVRVTPDALKHLRRGHPWVYDRSITSVSAPGRPGDLAVVFDDRNRFAAVGLYDPDSPIRVRVLQHGSPRDIDATFFSDTLSHALDRRLPLIERGDSDAYRWVHGENDGAGGLVIDRYGSTVVVKLYSAAWFSHLDDVVPAIMDLAGPERVVLRVARNVAAPGRGAASADGTVIVGRTPAGPIEFRENGLWFAADVLRGHKTGHFLDQRDNRALLQTMTDGADVLDVFSATGGFSVHAAAGGAHRVHSVDLSRGAIRAAEANMALNSAVPAVRAARHTTTVGDAMKVMGNLVRERRRFDVIVVDPPALASRASQRQGAIESHRRLAATAVRLLAPEGLLVQSCCSSRVTEDDLSDAVRRGARLGGVDLVEVRRTGQPLDHPVTFSEGRYLNTVVTRSVR